ncbi:MAG: response regulator [Caulobacterales bacterium]
MQDAFKLADPWAAKKSRLKFNFDKANAMVVDSNLLSLEVLSSILSGFGFRHIARFHDIRRAAEHIGSHGAEVIFIDPYSFGPEGFDFVKETRAGRLGASAAAPIFVVTGHAFMRAVTEMRDAGASYIIAKPFSPTILLDRILWVAANESRRVAAAFQNDRAPGQMSVEML